jgi:hypothetical protein
MKTRKNDSLVEFELQNSEMDNITGGTVGYSGGGIVGDYYCAKDKGVVETQQITDWLNCELI